MSKRGVNKGKEGRVIGLRANRSLPVINPREDTEGESQWKADGE